MTSSSARTPAFFSTPEISFQTIALQRQGFCQKRQSQESNQQLVLEGMR